MEHAQERVTTLHDLGDADPAAPTGDAAVVVPATERDHATDAADGLLAALADAGVARVVVALRAPAERVPAVAAWLDGTDADTRLVWCGGPRVERCLADAGLDGRRGKGRDVWLGLGVALDADPAHVAFHDADVRGVRPRRLRRLLFPLARGHALSKGYYARVETSGGDRRLYGRLTRLFYEPLVAALADRHDVRTHPLVAYLGAFRYALAGEVALTAGLAADLPVARGWGLEVGTLAAAFARTGFSGAAQVDLGVHRHAHRSVTGDGGLAAASEAVGERLLRDAAAAGVPVDHGALRAAYRETAGRYVDAYAADAAFNGLSHDAADEREQTARYAAAVRAPTGRDDRLPPWAAAPLDPGTVAEAAATDLAEVAS
jgi:glucosyl-3-phosphoglycerate synthase